MGIQELIQTLISGHYDIVTIVSILIAYTIYTFGKSRKCKVCRFSTFLAQMRVYKARISVIRNTVLNEFADLFNKKAEELGLSSEDKKRRLKCHRNHMLNCFKEGEEFYFDTLVCNHIPDPESQEFIKYCDEKFYEHQNIVWEPYEDDFDEEYYLIPIKGRRYDKNDLYLLEWCELMKIVYLIGKGEYETNDRK